MPFINGRYYMNPAYGRALEAAREAEERNRRRAQFAGGRESDAASTDSREDDHWVTKDHRHILIEEPSRSEGGTQNRAVDLSGSEIGLLTRIHAGLQNRRESTAGSSPTNRIGQQDDHASAADSRQQMNYAVSVGRHSDRRLVQPPTPVRVIISPDPPLPVGKYQVQVTLTKQTSDASNGSPVAAEVTAHIDDVMGGSVKVGSEQVPAVANKIPLTIGISARDGDFHYEGMRT